MLTFEILCATMHRSDFSLIKEMNIKSDVVFANQCDRTAYEEVKFDGHTAKMISTETRGVGKNRNLALIYASADICLFADDDVVYNDDYENTVCRFYEEHPDADVVVFNFLVSRNGSKPDNIVNKTKKLRFKKRSERVSRIFFYCIACSLLCISAPPIRTKNRLITVCSNIGLAR